MFFLPAVQGHTGGIPIEPELMDYVFIPHWWKKYVFHKGLHGTSTPYWDMD